MDPLRTERYQLFCPLARRSKTTPCGLLASRKSLTT